MNNELIVIKHCETIVCNEVPDQCPLCGKIVNYEAIPAPFYYPSPFLNGHHKKQALSLLIKPTVGEWNAACKRHDDLHIGVADDNGKVLSYNSAGLEKDEGGWEQSLVVYQVTAQDIPSWEQIWTNVLYRLEYDTLWSKKNYDEMEHNCFDFVLHFLQNVLEELIDRCGFVEQQRGFDFLLKGRDDKRMEFIKKYVTHNMEKAVEYSAIQSCVEKNGYSALK